jgi:hypothetical protein
LKAAIIKNSIDSLQKTAILGASHIIRKVLQSDTLSRGGEDHRWLKKRNGREKRLVTRNNIIVIIITLIMYFNTSNVPRAVES